MSIDITFPGNLALVDSVTALRALPSGLLNDNQVYQVADSGTYTYDAASVSVDNGTTVVKPNDKTPLQAGRWLLAGAGVFDAGLRTALSTGVGTSLVGYLNSGTTAASRTVQAWMRERPSIIDDGASGTGDATTGIVNALVDYGGGRIDVPRVTFSVSSVVTPTANTGLSGNGASSVFSKTGTVSHLFDATSGGFSAERIRFTGVNTGSNAEDGASVRAYASTGTTVRDSQFSGMATSPLLATNGATFGRYLNNYVSGMTGAIQNASDIMLYNNTSYNFVQGNRFEGGRSAGVYMQNSSRRNKVTFNFIAGQAGYGILDYEGTTPGQANYNLILGNTIENVTGLELIGGIDQRGGSGIYVADSGNGIIAHNHSGFNNLNTLVETLAPANIGVNASNSATSILTTGNQCYLGYWYGVMVLNGMHSHPVTSNVIHENKKDQLYFKNTDHAFAVGNALTALTQLGTQERCINVNVVSAGKRGALISSNRMRGSSLAALDYRNTAQGAVVGNVVTEATGRGIQIQEASDLTLTANVADVSAGTGIALNLVNVSYSVVSALTLKIGNSATVAIDISGTCTGLFIDRTVIISGKPDPMNFVNNNGGGCIVEQWGTAIPTLGTHQVGDKVYNRTPTAGGNIGWVCTTAGTGGGAVWKTFGAIAA